MKLRAPFLRLRSASSFPSGRSVLLGVALLFGASGSSLLAQTSSTSYSGVAATNSHAGGQYYYLASSYHDDGANVQAQGNHTFAGNDRIGNPRTMLFSGTARASSVSTQLHVYANGTVANTYYNAANPAFYDGQNVNEAGSPDFLTAFSFAQFSDTLQYSGALQIGYTARYFFHVDGSNTGYGTTDYLTVTIAGGQEQTFSNDDQGNLDATYTATGHVNGQSPQTINVLFSAQFNLDLTRVPDGSNYNSTASYSDTAMLTGIMIVDADGNPVSGVTVTSASGTMYPIIVPEPSTWAAVFGGCGMLALVSRRRVAAR